MRLLTKRFDLLLGILINSSFNIECHNDHDFFHYMLNIVFRHLKSPINCFKVK